MSVLTATHPKADDRRKYVQPLVTDAAGEVLAERWTAWTAAAQPSGE